uniref:DNA cross-link repair 1A protein n=1 Tax=Myripristis murdjan TaxID=586833 RepID=A0A668A597_9TELE
MSQKDSENDIWDYKPLQKKKKTEGALSSAAKKRCTSKKTAPKKDTSLSVRRGRPGKAAATGDFCGNINKEEHGTSEAQTLPSQPPSGVSSPDHAAEGSSCGGFCPICQMPFSILVVQSQRWHVAECLDTPRDTNKECPDGVRCSSTIPNHYRRYNHTLLAHGRATSDIVLLSLSQQAETSLGCLTELINTEADSSVLESSQDSAVSLSALSNPSASPVDNHSGTPPAKLTNGLMLLRSPGPEDFKKKKGWLSSAKGQKSISSSQESKTELPSTPVKADREDQASEGGFVKTEHSPYSDDLISYSPLSEFPADIEVNDIALSKACHSSEAFENKDEDSLTLFSDGFSSEDELFSDFIDHLEPNNVQLKEQNTSAFSDTQLGSVTSLAPCNQLDTPAAAENTSTSEKDTHDNYTSANSPCKANFKSPQSIVLERLRETLLSSNNLHCSNLTDSSAQSQQSPELPHQVPSAQTVIQTSSTMAPRKGQSKAGQASCLKQTDIGVFFGLKPLKEKVQERKPRAERTTDTSNDKETPDVSDAVGAQGEGGRGGTRPWRRRRWNRGKTDGEPEEPRCPFYKKIPGTKFTVDAFRYGEIEGISAYFLTHFHSDHYGGLKKNSTLPIYCNKITGNLVKSKLKVAEQYVHILPMNTPVTVEGVRVILLDANHCPGAAMLLFFLPDGQTVLHTGDFRADPSMESYPELLSCRVQTLYLDTTYCSPEYTFPSQQEVITFAANTTFELVTLKPRTLVVCGSYSVGKEKVFLALAELLGSKVCLSRDKYNTMCCLESETIRQLITTDWKAAQVHVLPMMQLSFNKLQAHLHRFSGQYEQLVAFKPTGWTFSQQLESVEDIQPQTSGNISIYGIPYSEHSSFLEMKRFVQWLQPLKIIPTVNNGSWASRRAMEKCFSEWLAEAKAKRKS